MRCVSLFVPDRERGRRVQVLGAGSLLDLSSPACSIGSLRACYEAALDHARIRVQGGKPIVQHQLIAAQLSEMRVRIEAARILLYRQAWCCRISVIMTPN